MVDYLDELREWGRMPLALGGWDDYSVWGWDEQAGSLFAQLWRNTDHPRNAPREWITPGQWPATSSPVVLAGYIAMATGCAESDVRRAMAASAPEAVREQLTSAG